MRISDWSSDVCSSDLVRTGFPGHIIRQYAGIELVFSDQGSGSQAFGRVAGSDGDFHLAKDRTIIKFRRDDMDGAACNIVPCLQCALMRVEALIVIGRASCRDRGVKYVSHLLGR